MINTSCSAVVLGLILISGAISCAAGQNVHGSIEASSAFSMVPNSAGVAARTISPVLDVLYPLGSDFAVGGQWGFTFLSLDRTGFEHESRVDAGNPLIFVAYRLSPRPNWLECSLGLRAGIPVAVFPGNIPDNRAAEFNYNNANSAHGWRNPFLWMMNIVPAMIDVNLNGTISHGLHWDLALTPSYLISVNSRPSRNAFLGLLGLDVAVGGVHLSGGTSWFYSTLSLENNDHDQWSVWLGAGVRALSGQFHIEINLNLDGPNGFTLGSPKPTWGIVLRYKWQTD